MITNNLMSHLYDIETYDLFMLKESSCTYQVLPYEGQVFLSTGDVRVKNLHSGNVEFLPENTKVFHLQD